VDAAVAKTSDSVVELIRSDREIARAVKKACGISRQALAMWNRVPIARVPTVAKILGLTYHAIRPDHFPPDEPVALTSAKQQGNKVSGGQIVPFE
jgi:hypothetical protein